MKNRFDNLYTLCKPFKRRYSKRIGNNIKNPIQAKYKAYKGINYRLFQPLYDFEHLEIAIISIGKGFICLQTIKYIPLKIGKNR